MAAEIIKVGDVSVLFGVSLKSAQDTKRKKEAKRFAQQARANYFSSGEFAGGAKLFAANVNKHAGKQKTVIPAIAAFAALTNAHDNENHAWLIKLANDLVCLQIVAGNSPYSDDIIDAGKAANTLADKYSELQLERGMTLHATGDFDDAFLSQFAEINKLDVQELLAHANINDIKMSLITNYAQLAVPAVAAISILAYYAYQYYDEQQAAALQQAKQQAAALSISKRDVVQDYEQSVNESLKNGVISSDSFLAEIEKAVFASDLTVAGWNLVKVDCTQTQCTKTYSQGNGSRADLKKTITKNLSVSDKSANETVELRASASEILRENLVSQVQNDDYFFGVKESVNQIVTIDAVIDKAVIVGQIKLEDAQQIPADKKIYSGKFSLTAPLGLIKEIFPTLPKNLSVQQLTIEPITDVSTAKFTLSGEYFVK